jgi:nucleoside-diphosphate-sugar epimerase
VLAKRRDVIVQDAYPAARLRDVVADIEDPAHRRFFDASRLHIVHLAEQRAREDRYR